MRTATRTQRTSVWWVVDSGLILLMLASVLVWLRGDGPLPAGVAPHANQLLVVVPSSLTALILGGVIGTRSSERRYAWVWLTMGLAGTVLALGEAYVVLDMVGYWRAPLVDLFAFVADASWLVLVAAVPLVLVLFPTGEPPNQRWRWLPRTVLVLTALIVPFASLTPGKFGVVPLEKPIQLDGAPGDAAAIAGGTLVVLLLLLVVPAALSLIFRFRNSRGIERLQIKWLMLGGVAAIASGIVGQLDLPGVIDPFVEELTVVAPAAGVGIAILRYRLYDIDRIINRTLVYGSLTAFLGALYFGVVIALQSVFPGEGTDLEVAGSTLVTAALFSPARRRIQTFIDKRFYRHRYDARRSLEGFTARLRDEIDLDSLTVDLMGVVAGTVRPAHAGLWLRRGPS
jgi:hypothetical protein